jgi:multidrug resistance efflux pump
MKKLLKKLRDPKIIKLLISLVTLFLLIASFVYVEKRIDRVYIDDSLVFAPIISISSITPGKLTQMNVYEGESIKKGYPLATVGTQTLYADTDGLVIMANKQIGSIMSSQNIVVQLINSSDMRIAGTIDENKGLNSIHIGQVASFTIDALPGKTFWGYVDEVSPSAKQTQIAFSISSERPTQQFVVYVRFDANAYPEIKNGMSAKLIIYTKTH